MSNNDNNIELSKLNIDEIMPQAEQYAKSIVSSLIDKNQGIFIATNQNYLKAKSVFLAPGNRPTLTINYGPNGVGYKNFNLENKIASTVYSITANSLSPNDIAFFEHLDKCLAAEVTENINKIRTRLGVKQLTTILPFISGSAKNDDNDIDSNKEPIVKYLKLSLTANYVENKAVPGYKCIFYKTNSQDIVEKQNPQNTNDLTALLCQGVSGKCIIDLSRVLFDTTQPKIFRIIYTAKAIRITKVEASSESVFLSILGINPSNTNNNNNKSKQINNNKQLIDNLSNNSAETSSEDEDEEEEE